MLNGSTISGKCGENARKIQFSLRNATIIFGKQNYIFEYSGKDFSSPFLNVEFKFMISGQFLTINKASPIGNKLHKEFFTNSMLGPFLEEYAGLWLLAADIVPKLSQKRKTKLMFMVPDECELTRVEFPPQNCATFKHSAISKMNPLISGGSKLAINRMPWTVYFLATVANGFQTMGYSCTASLISPQFVLLAAHCFDNLKENGPFSLVCVHCGPTEKFKNGKAFIAGWGNLKNSCGENGQESPVKLMGRTAQLIKCSKSLAKDGQERICIEKDSIQKGDSGGALLGSNGTNFVQIGVASAIYCNFIGKHLLGLYTRLDGCWIEQITGVQCGI
ncbi:hypothetical protein niasHS_009262 [Heterodera schachtii]|uniref:Peptidase S1 domain-containing protein n=1 Tax=Heterodera schachtii TaxID=97005 RepID=A0ABD2J3Q2_HETSC